MALSRNLFVDGKAIFLACDQGIEHGPKDFNEVNVDPSFIVSLAKKDAVSGLILLPGTAEKYYNTGDEQVPLIVKVNSKTAFQRGDSISLQHCSVDRAVGMNAAAIGYTIYPGSAHEHIMYQELGRIIEQAHAAKLPVVVWAYPRGEAVYSDMDTDTIAYGARIASELGADIIKLKYNHDPDGFRWVLKNAGRARVMVSGGDLADPRAALETFKEVMDLGAAGIAIGRNIWQNEKPYAFSKALANIVFKGMSVDRAYAQYEKAKK